MLRAFFVKNKYRLGLIYRHKTLYLFFILPSILLLFLFAYRPMLGLIVAFQDFSIGSGSFFDSPFVGFANFEAFLNNPRFYQALQNTLGISFFSLIVSFPLPIIFALLLNEIRKISYKRIVQTITYLPHFISWVVVATMVYKVLDPHSGAINQLLRAMGLDSIPFMREPQYFWSITILSNIWKELGWSAIIYIAAMTSVDPQLYEAARIDGAGRLQCMRYITLPSIAQTIALLFILQVGSLITSGGLFDAVYNLSNPMVNERSYTLEMYAYYEGISFGRFAYATAITLTQSIIGFFLVFFSNQLYTKMTSKSVF